MVDVLKFSCESGICGYVSLSEAFIVSCKISMALLVKNGTLPCIAFGGLFGGTGGCIIDGGFLDGGVLNCGFLDGGFLVGGFLVGVFLDGGFQNCGFRDGGFRDGGWTWYPMCWFLDWFHNVWFLEGAW